MESSSPTWKELLGENNWRGLLDDPPPMDLSLRKFILRCGNFAEATYDAFENDPNFSPSGNLLNDTNKGTFFRDVYLQNGDDYKVVSFLYATSGFNFLDILFPRPPSGGATDPNTRSDRIANWMGYVAVTNDDVSAKIGRREIYVAWRGTSVSTEWETNSQFINLESIDPLLPLRDNPTRPLDHEAQVHAGFLSVYTSKRGGSSYAADSAGEQLRKVIKDLMKEYEGEDRSIVITGHSLGGALATLSAFSLVANGISDIPVTAVVFSCPKVGNQAFKNLVHQHRNLKILHVLCGGDFVPALPIKLRRSYVPIQTTQLMVYATKSPYLKWVLWPPTYHNLELVLHLVAGWNGPSFLPLSPTNPFELKVKRSFVLVNKWTGALLDGYGVPESWWLKRKELMEYKESTQEWVVKRPPKTG
ncbi:Fungal lipase-like domain containing protein [Trema orientale]|uniref:Phospholipase A1 n=1 Tax=Trema orientale TaxID=63057 RepID=A0A2P5FL16_TREOI|nr:Fungal lipase-like domain containing protein [Trema orientale]